MNSLPVTRNNLDSQFEAIWRALEGYRENCIPEGQEPQYDEEWNDICTAMAWICEELNNAGCTIDDQY
jgi:hypothetical protein